MFHYPMHMEVRQLSLICFDRPDYLAADSSQTASAIYYDPDSADDIDDDDPDEDLDI